MNVGFGATLMVRALTKLQFWIRLKARARVRVTARVRAIDRA